MHLELMIAQSTGEVDKYVHREVDISLSNGIGWTVKKSSSSQFVWLPSYNVFWVHKETLSRGGPMKAPCLDME